MMTLILFIAITATFCGGVYVGRKWDDFMKL